MSHLSRLIARRLGRAVPLAAWGAAALVGFSGLLAAAPAARAQSAHPNVINLGNVQGQWVSLGPNGILVVPGTGIQSGQTGSYVGGRAAGVAYDPKNASVFYLATYAGGVWKFNPADPSSPTAPWRALGDAFPTLQTRCVTVSPNDSNVVLVGLAGQGIMLSLNAGASFQQVGSFLGTVYAIRGNPDNEKQFFASSSNGVFVSNDKGISWNNIIPPDSVRPLAFDNSNPPKTYVMGRSSTSSSEVEPWSDIALSGKDTNGVRYLYAADQRAGLFVCSNAKTKANPTGAFGTDWVYVTGGGGKLFAYNPVDTSYVDPYAGNYALKITAGTQAGLPTGVYVEEGNQVFNDGRLWKCDNLTTATASTPGNWVDVTANYPVRQGKDNNWTTSHEASSMISVPIPAGGEAVFAGTGENYLAPFGLANQSLGNLSWMQPEFTHRLQHGYAYAPSQTNLPAQTPPTLLVANDGGAYQLTRDNTGTNWSYAPGSALAPSGITVNQNLDAVDFFGAAFHPTFAGTMLGGIASGGAARTRPPGGANSWQTLPNFGTLFSTMQQDDEIFDLSKTDFLSRYEIATAVPLYVGAAAYDRNNPRAQYLVSRDGQNLFVTTDDWVHGWDITPSRTLPVKDMNGKDITVYAFPQVTPQDSSTAGWATETKNPRGIIATYTFPFGRTVVYTGGTSVWRYDLTPGFAQLADPKNIDRGLWRPVGATQLATEPGDYITAIAVGDEYTFGLRNGLYAGTRIYAGTHLGRLWTTINALPDGTPTSGKFLPIPATWTEIDNQTLPSRDSVPDGKGGMIKRFFPITTVSINPVARVNQNASSDIVVGMDGNGIDEKGQFVQANRGLYRNANTSSPTFLFTPANGNGGANGTVNFPSADTVTGMVRDTVTLNADKSKGDPVNSWFVSTNTGVYFTNNQGSTWTNVGRTFGLPNVGVAALDINSTTGLLSVATAGRGAYFFDLANATQLTTPGTAVFTQASTNYALNRGGDGSILLTVTVKNSGNVSASNVTVSNLAITNGRKVASGSPPSVIVSPSTIGAGRAGTAQSSWAASVGARGAIVTLSYTISFQGGVDVPISIRTRLP